jgi:lipid-binding SYLF domain-containing protein
MLKRLLIVTTLVVLATLTAVASDREDDVQSHPQSCPGLQGNHEHPGSGHSLRICWNLRNVSRSFQETVKFAFIFGGSYGRGLATCRTGHGWSAPMFVAIDSGSVGYQIGGSSTDLVMLFMNDHALAKPAQRQIQTWRGCLCSRRAGRP